jgi:hypothetical protein
MEAAGFPEEAARVAAGHPEETPAEEASVEAEEEILAAVEPRETGDETSA